MALLSYQRCAAAHRNILLDYCVERGGRTPVREAIGFFCKRLLSLPSLSTSTCSRGFVQGAKHLVGLRGKDEVVLGKPADGVGTKT